MEQYQKLEKVLQKLQQQIAQDAANYRTQIALLEVELEDAQQQVRTLEALLPKDGDPGPQPSTSED